MPALTQTVLKSLLCSSAVLVYLFRIVFLTLITGEVRRWWFREDYVKVEATASDLRSKTLIAARYDIKSSRLSNSRGTGWPAERSSPLILLWIIIRKNWADTASLARSHRALSAAFV